MEILFNGKLNDTIRKQIVELVRSSNEEILNTLEKHAPTYQRNSWGIVDPPTARILSKPVELYMEAMMQHPYVQEELSLIL